MTDAAHFTRSRFITTAFAVGKRPNTSIRERAMSTKTTFRLACAALLMSLSACANLGAIREFASISSDSAGYTTLTKEYASSPTRLKKYTLSAEEGQRAELDRQAKDREPQVKKLMLYHAAVSSYMKALADLSSGDIASFDLEIKGLTDQALASEYINAREAGLINALGGAIANAATDFYRQKKLKQVIGQANDPLQDVLGTMDTLVRAYGESLETEKGQIGRYYDTLAATARAEKQSALSEQIWTQGGAERERLDGRVRAADSYRATLVAIGKAHQDLYDQRNDLSQKEVQRQIREYANKIRAAYKAVREDD